MGKQEEKPRTGETPRQTSVQQLLLTVPEVARLLRLSEAKIYTMLADRCSGGIPVKRFGRSLRISLGDLRRWLEEQGSSGDAYRNQGNVRKENKQ